MFAIITVSQDILPSGWYRAFASQSFGATKGIYTAFPGPVPRSTTLLSFLGITFVPVFIGSDGVGSDKTNAQWDWNWGFRRPCDHQSPARRRSINKGTTKLSIIDEPQPSVEPYEAREQDAKSGLRDKDESPTQGTSSNQALIVTKPQRKSRDLS